MSLVFGLRETRNTDVKDVIYNSILMQCGPDAAQRSLEGCKALQSLRADVVLVSRIAKPSQKARDALLDYYRGMNYAAERVEIENNAQFKIVWTDSFDKRKVFESSSLTVERMAVIHNVAALESAQGVVNEMTDDKESMEASFRNFRIAAGLYTYLAEKQVSPDDIPSTDFDPDTALVISKIMIANAQIKYLELCLRTENIGLKNKAQLAMGVTAAIKNASNALTTANKRGITVGGVPSKMENLGVYLQAWSMYYTAVANEYQAEYCGERFEISDQLAHYREASEQLADAKMKIGACKQQTALKEHFETLTNQCNKLEALVRKNKQELDEYNSVCSFKQASEVTPSITPKECPLATQAQIDDFLHTKPAPESVIKSLSAVVPKSMASSEWWKHFNTKLEGAARTYASQLSVSKAALLSAKKDLESFLASKTRTQPVDPNVVDILKEATAAGGHHHLSKLVEEIRGMAEESEQMTSSIETKLADEIANDSYARRDVEKQGIVLNQPLSSHREDYRMFASAVAEIRSHLDAASSMDKSIAEEIQNSESKLKVLAEEAAENSRGIDEEEEQLRVRVGRALNALTAITDEIGELRSSAYTKSLNVPTNEAERETYFSQLIRETFDPVQKKVGDACWSAGDVEKEVREKLASSGDSGSDPARSRNQQTEREEAAKLWGHLRGKLFNGMAFYRGEQNNLVRIQADTNRWAEDRDAERTYNISTALKNMSISGRRNPAYPSGPAPSNVAPTYRQPGTDQYPQEFNRNQLDPRSDPRNDPRFDPRYDPRYQPQPPSQRDNYRR